MSITIPQTFVYQFRDNVILLSQQRGSKLRAHVREEESQGIKHFFDRIAATDVVEKTTRHQDTPQIDTIHDRRAVGMRDFGWSDLIDREDRIRQLIEPTSPMVRSAVMAMGRKIDNLILVSAIGNAESGQFGGTTVAFDTTNFQIVHGSVGLTVDKVRQAARIMDESDVMPEDRFFAISPQGKEDLLADSEVTSSDFVTSKPLETGMIGNFMGFQFIIHTGLALSSTTRSCVAFARDGIGLALGAEITVDVDRRSDKWNAQQILITWSGNATRVEDPMVIEVQITEA